MGREERKRLLEEVIHFKTKKELQDNNWLISSGDTEKRYIEDRRCVTDNYIWKFEHQFEEGLWAKFYENEDKTLKIKEYGDSKVL